MDKVFAEFLKEKTTKVNPLVMNGLASKYMEYGESYLNEIIKSVAKSFPKGLVYHGMERCTPEEEFAAATKVKTNKRVFDLALSNLYMVKLLFSYNNEPISPRYLYLPQIQRAGTIHLGGTLYQISPVISDKVISPGNDYIFVKLIRDRLNFKKCYHSVSVNGESCTGHVIWSQIYKKVSDAKKIQPTTNALTCLSHYLFAKYGIRRAFEKYTGCFPIIGEDLINEKNYPPEEGWSIISSAHREFKPKTYIGNYYNATNIRVAVKTDVWENNAAFRNMVVAFFYVVDHFPDQIRASYLNEQNIKAETDHWKVLLGSIIWSGAIGHGRLLGQVNEHFNNLDSHVDTIIVNKLAENNYFIEDFYDLLGLMIAQFNNIISANKNNSFAMAGKSFEILYYAYFNVTSAIVNFNFRLSKMVNGKLKKGRPILIRDIIDIFNRYLKQGAIYKLTSSNIAVEPVSYSGDHMFIKIASKMVQQEGNPKQKNKGRRTVAGPEKHIDAGMMLVGSLLALSKSDPDSLGRVNPFIELDPKTLNIIVPEKFVSMVEETNRLLRMKK